MPDTAWERILRWMLLAALVAVGFARITGRI
jgi:hypothetical protein